MTTLATPSPSPSAAPGPLSVSFLSFNNLSVIAVVFSALSALFGAYVILFVLAVWSTYSRTGTSYRRLRIVTIVLFINLLTHYICRGITFGRARLVNPPAGDLRMVDIPIVFIGSITCTFAGFLSDGLVAWRFYVVYGRKRWAMYLPATAVIVNALLGFSGDFQHLEFYRSTQTYTETFKLHAFKINAAWGWFMFGINTVLSGAIIGRIIYISKSTDKHNAACSYGGKRYNTALAAVTESALVTWVGLLLYEIAAIAPTGHITSVWNVGYVMVCIIPMFFGISQCLITARLGIVNDGFDLRESNRDHAVAMSFGADSGRAAREITITVSRETVIDAEKGAVDL
ncbi:hypothetical protein BDY19DRAFT_995948 [Irpex rosettiformis]|uniref:Uncharacterized protein n=1 Tax=Irpex rosettiformis TaxID=378272 RepID=A0ACB8TWD6_9APHY|nr:hypothetical protein BDY19DRAFT_995948 [Irpex rosettiformis]